MILSALQLRNFRKHTESAVQFSPGLNFLTGGNGAGKTTILEAVYYLCTTRNFKGVPDEELTSFGSSGFALSGIFSENSEIPVSIIYSTETGKRQYTRSGKNIHRASEVIGKFPVTLLTPEDHAITQGSPAGRRKFIDSVIAQESALYLSTLLKYNHILSSRSVLLKKLNEHYSPSTADELEVWDEQLITEGSFLVSYRLKFLKELNEFLAQVYGNIMHNEEQPLAEYTPEYGSDPAAFLRSELQRRRNEEIRRGMNLSGPHRDDIAFSINTLPLRLYGSQGQHKTFQIALRFAQFFYLKEKTGTSPIFLLDDVFGEVDRYRAGRISEYLRQVGQAFITVTDLPNINFFERTSGDSFFTISNGVITRGE